MSHGCIVNGIRFINHTNIRYNVPPKEYKLFRYRSIIAVLFRGITFIWPLYTILSFVVYSIMWDKASVSV